MPTSAEHVKFKITGNQEKAVRFFHAVYNKGYSCGYKSFDDFLQTLVHPSLDGYGTIKISPWGAGTFIEILSGGKARTMKMNTTFAERQIHDVKDEPETQDNWSADDLVRWTNGQVYKLDELPQGGLGLRVFVECGTCHARGDEVFIVRGAPSWCYVHDLSGEYQADLRSQKYICASCAESVRPDKDPV